MLPPWVIVETKSLSEDIAERNLRQAGYRVYLPRFRRLLSPHSRGRKPVTSMRPLFERMLFAQDWRGWPAVPIGGTMGLMLLRAGVPARLSDDDVSLIMARERAGEFDEVQHAKGSGFVVRTDIEAGEAIQIEAYGTRVMGVLEELTEEGRAIVKAMLFGRLVRTSVDADKIQRATG